MAQAQLGILLNTLQGKVGNAVFKKTKNGTVVTPRTKGKNPKTAAQTAVRNNLSTVSKNWKNLTAGQLTSWANYAADIIKHNQRTEKAYVPTGFNVYSGLSTKFLQVDPAGTPPPSPPLLSPATPLP